jgi:shikimate dehydrogenase
MTSSVLLLGDSVSSSLSPGFQHAAFMALGIDCRYIAREVPPAQLAALIDEIRADASILGANVTIPHKEAVIPLLDDLDPLARKVGAVNTISRQGARLKGWNTDVEGFRRALTERSPSPRVGEMAESPSPLVGEGRGGGYRRIAIIGAGGAARAVAAAMQSTGATIWIVARDLERARRLCRDLTIEGGGAISLDRIASTIADADLVVNATPADLPAESWVRPGQRVFDLRYRRSRDGLAMLLHQGAAAFEIWTGRPAPLQVMRTTLERSTEWVPA